MSERSAPASLRPAAAAAGASLLAGSALAAVLGASGAALILAPLGMLVLALAAWPDEAGEWRRWGGLPRRLPRLAGAAAGRGWGWAEFLRPDWLRQREGAQAPLAGEPVPLAAAPDGPGLTEESSHLSLSAAELRGRIVSALTEGGAQVVLGPGDRRFSGALWRGRNRWDIECALPGQVWVSAQELGEFLVGLRARVAEESLAEGVEVSSGGLRGVSVRFTPPTGVVRAPGAGDGGGGPTVGALAALTAIQRSVVESFTGRGWQVVVSHGANRMAGRIQHGSRRAIFELVLAPGAASPPAEVDQFFVSIQDGLDDPQVTGFAVADGPLAGSRVDFLDRRPREIDPAAEAAGSEERGPLISAAAAFAAVVDLFRAYGYRPVTSAAQTGLAELVEKGGRRIFIDLMALAGRVVAGGELEFFLGLIARGLAAEGEQVGFKVSGGSLAGSVLEFLPMVRPPTRSLLRTALAPGAAWARRSVPYVFALGGMVFPGAGDPEGPEATFFRRYGALCLLLGQEPYPVPLTAIRAALAERKLIEPGMAGVLRLLVTHPHGANPGAAVQEWLDRSPEVEEPRRDARLALQQSATLTEYLERLRIYRAKKA